MAPIPPLSASSFPERATFPGTVGFNPDSQDCGAGYFNPTRFETLCPAPRRLVAGLFDTRVEAPTTLVAAQAAFQNGQLLQAAIAIAAPQHTKQEIVTALARVKTVEGEWKSFRREFLASKPVVISNYFKGSLKTKIPDEAAFKALPKADQELLWECIAIGEFINARRRTEKKTPFDPDNRNPADALGTFAKDAFDAEDFWEGWLKLHLLSLLAQSKELKGFQFAMLPGRMMIKLPVSGLSTPVYFGKDAFWSDELYSEETSRKDGKTPRGKEALHSAGAMLSIAYLDQATALLLDKSLVTEEDKDKAKAEALTALKRAAIIGGEDNVQHLLTRGTPELNDNNSQRCLTYYLRAQVLNPNAVFPHYFIGRAGLQSGGVAGAVRNFEKAHELRPEDPLFSAYLSYAKALSAELTRDWVTASSEMTQAVEFIQQVKKRTFPVEIDPSLEQAEWPKKLAEFQAKLPPPPPEPEPSPTPPAQVDTADGATPSPTP